MAESNDSVASTKKDFMEIRDIENHPGFSISRDGKVFDSFGNVRKTYKNGDGYVGVSIKRKDGLWITYGLHRLLAIAFIARSDNPEAIEVNHRDSNVEHNDINNLEWVTPSQNNVHSEITRKDNQFFTVYSMRDGIAMDAYKNVWAAQEATGIKALDVWDSIKDGKEICGWKFIHRPFSGSLPPGIRSKIFKASVKVRSPSPKPIKILDITNGAVRLFDSITDAANKFNTWTSHVVQSIPNGSYPKVFMKRYQVAYLDQEFPAMTREEMARALNHGPRRVLAYNVAEKKFYVYSSAKAFVFEYGLSKKAVTKDLARGRLRVISGWVTTYISRENMISIKAFISGLADMSVT